MDSEQTLIMEMSQMSLKTFYSQICLAVPGKSEQGYDSPIILASDNLAHVAADLCNQLGQLHLIKPLARNIVPQNFNINHIILSKYINMGAVMACHVPFMLSAKVC